uniref:Uncharacterized protein n=1 Tax=Ciona savignyi TaxID=51511 RepID=H2ZCL1_CIOSA
MGAIIVSLSCDSQPQLFVNGGRTRARSPRFDSRHLARCWPPEEATGSFIFGTSWEDQTPADCSTPCEGAMGESPALIWGRRNNCSQQAPMIMRPGYGPLIPSV